MKISINSSKTPINLSYNVRKKENEKRLKTVSIDKNGLTDFLDSGKSHGLCL